MRSFVRMKRLSIRPSETKNFADYSMHCLEHLRPTLRPKTMRGEPFRNSNFLPVLLSRTCTAECLPVLNYFLIEIDAFAALCTSNSCSAIPWKFRGGNFDLHPPGREEIAIRQFTIREHLLLILVLNLRV